MSTRRLLPVLFAAATLGSTVLGGSPVTAAPSPFCVALKSYNDGYIAAYAKAPTDVKGLTKARVAGLRKLAKAAPAEIAPSVTAMADHWDTGKGKLGPSLLKVSAYADKQCKLPIA